VEGVLAPYAPGYRVWLAERGYRPATVEDQVWLMSHLSRWLGEQTLEPGAFDDATAERFQGWRRGRYSHLTGARALRSLLGYLRGLGVMPAPVIADSSVERLLAEYRDYLVRERGLVAGSVRLRERVARAFLTELAEPLEDALEGLRRSDVTALSRRSAARAAVGWRRRRR
jgi:integrase/recombinase XerD